MKVERKCPKTGFKEVMETDGNYCPPGWKRVLPVTFYHKETGREFIYYGGYRPKGYTIKKNN